MSNNISVKVYHGYGHSHNLVVYGHVFKYKAKTNQRFSNNLWVNIVHLLRLFIVKPFAFVKVRLVFEGQIVETHATFDGFFRLEWVANQYVPAGWHSLEVKAIGDKDEILAIGCGHIYVPHLNQYAFISDIDDTIMVSHSATLGRRLRELFIKNPHTRKTFPSAQQHYQLLAYAHTNLQQPNPFFYVSSSEWNLYDYLVEIFRFNGLPEGAFLLNHLKRWRDLFTTGKTGHEGKLLRIMRIVDVFPNQKFVFFGDNSQFDPFIYKTIAEKYADNMVAVYIRNVRKSRKAATEETLQQIALKGVHFCLFSHSDEAIAHSKKIGLID